MALDKERKKILFLFLAICTFYIPQKYNAALAAEDKLADEIELRQYFSCYNCSVDWNALADLKNNSILNSCLTGATLDKLRQLGLEDLQVRLEKLQKGNVVKKIEDKYYLAFPAVVGEKRAELQQLIEQAAKQLMPSAEDAVKQIQPNLKQNPEMLFHVLWSIVMDGAAWQTVRTEFINKFNQGNISLEGVGWLMYPAHPYHCGTNSYSDDVQIGEVKITWSMATALTPSAPWVLLETIKKYDNQLTQSLTTGQPIKDQQAIQDLAQYGLVDGKGQLTAYIIDPNSQAAQVFYQLGLEFGRKATSSLDVQKIADILNVTPKQAVVIAYHELCYEILKQLTEKDFLQVPEILLNSEAKTTQTRFLVSIILLGKSNSLK